MQGGWCFWRATGELPQLGLFRDGASHGDWLRFARDGSLENQETFLNGEAVKRQGFAKLPAPDPSRSQRP